jgi:hypothetical protein
MAKNDTKNVFFILITQRKIEMNEFQVRLDVEVESGQFYKDITLPFVPCVDMDLNLDGEGDEEVKVQIITWDHIKKRFDVCCVSYPQSHWLKSRTEEQMLVLGWKK